MEKEKKPRLVELFGYNSTINKDIIEDICYYYHIKCREASAEVEEILIMNGIIEKNIELGFYQINFDNLKNSEIMKKVVGELEHMDKYVILLTEENEWFFEILEVDDEEDFEFLIEYLENQTINKY
ncbi:MAG: hypothetical protein QXW71_05835 [Thermoplasmata archaeon]